MKKIIAVLIIAILAVMAAGCSNEDTQLGGFYQSDFIGSEIVQISVNSDNGEFVQYISSRQVNSGIYTKNKEGLYEFDGDVHSFTVTLIADDSFEVVIPKLNGDTPIKLSQISENKSVFTTIGGQENYNDIEEYKDLLE
ncbi:hypothetical protein [Anaerovorax sp. IOR16]|uniref:hypothetical protein n=1 Tax=Anaerovorax sp. IOR16 TaxID=2773458 RepID=UPI0019D23C03|nr:hypothetical protein [Anaerovorax sp. IOR16]